jgi:hypothetical protein
MCCFIELGLQISRKVYLLHTISLLESTENDNDVVMCSIITTFGSSLPPVVCRRDQALFRDRPFHLKGGGGGWGYGFLLRSEKKFRTTRTRVRIIIFFVTQSANFFSRI